MVLASCPRVALSLMWAGGWAWLLHGEDRKSDGVSLRRLGCTETVASLLAFALIPSL